MARHLDALFSEAFDGALDDAERRRFDDHLEICAQCRDAFADYAAALQAVRELPPARMSAPVVIPTTAPQLETEPRRRHWSAAIPGWLARPGPTTTGLGLAAAGVAAVVIAVHAGHGENTDSGGARPLAESGASSANSAAGGGAGASGARGATRLTSPDCAFTVPASSSAPRGFDNAVRQTDPSRPGQQLILATTGAPVHAGDRLTVYARLIAPGATTAVVPCVSLAGVSNGVAASANQPPGAAAPAPAEAPPAAPTAQPTTYGAADSAPLLSIPIPSGLAPGTVLHLVAQVPASIPEQGNATVQAVLTITVS